MEIERHVWARRGALLTIHGLPVAEQQGLAEPRTLVASA
jgi:hypothetical protein